MESFYIDPEAKAKVELTKISHDVNGHPYYIGKLQFPGTLEFESGASFFVFVSENGCEELQIAPLDPSRKSKPRRNANMTEGKFCIDLHSMLDQNGNTYYVGEVIGLAELQLRKGIFFTIFVSKPGHEELQISRLNPKKRRNRFEERETPVEIRSRRTSNTPSDVPSEAP